MTHLSWTKSLDKDQEYRVLQILSDCRTKKISVLLAACNIAEVIKSEKKKLFEELETITKLCGKE